MAYRLISSLAFCALACTVSAREIVVQVIDGRTSPSLESVTKQLAPGDVVKIQTGGGIVRDGIKLNNLKGTAEAPIVIDGGGCTLLGTEPLRPAEWEEVGDGVYKSIAWVKRLQFSKTDLQRFYVVFDDAVQNMGRISKGKQPLLPAASSLQPGQWTYDPSTSTLYIRLKPEQSLESSGVEFPERDSGVAISGMNSAFVEIRNITAKRFLNDGYNIHGKCDNIHFENIAAIECGDDGFSAHDDCSVSATNYRAERNATGICNVNRSVFQSSKVSLRNNQAYELFVLDASKNTIEGGEIESVQSKPLVARGSDKDPTSCYLTLKNVTIKSGQQGALIALEKDTIFSATEISSFGCSWQIAGVEAELSNSKLSGIEAAVRIADGSIWKASGNSYAVGSIDYHGKSYKPDQFPAYQAASGQDALSTYATP